MPDASDAPAPKRLGAIGEALLVAYLTNLGWRILETNYRSPYGEIDLIAAEPTTEGETLVFLEVKTRRGTRHGAPSESVHARKRQKIVATAQCYLGQRSPALEEPACRFDVAEVFVGATGFAQVHLVRGAFGVE